MTIPEAVCILVVVTICGMGIMFVLMSGMGDSQEDVDTESEIVVK